MVSFFMDVNVRAEITRGLRLRGIDVLTAVEDGTRELNDSALLDRATSLGRVLFTRDADLLVEGTARQRNGLTFGGVVYAHQLHVSIGECIEYLELIGKAGEPSEWINRVEYLPLK
jgi:hypothetical protein